MKVAAVAAGGPFSRSLSLCPLILLISFYDHHGFDCHARGGPEGLGGGPFSIVFLGKRRATQSIHFDVH